MHLADNELKYISVRQLFELATEVDFNRHAEISVQVTVAQCVCLRYKHKLMVHLNSTCPHSNAAACNGPTLRLTATPCRCI
jgi:hypothetical protein